MRKLCVFFLLFAGATYAQEKPAPVREQVEKLFGTTVEARYDQPYAGNSNRRQMLDLFLPKKRVEDKPLPVIVLIHGGGWSGGDRSAFTMQAATLANSGKYATVSVGYRLSNEATWPAPIHDCKAAIRWIRGHANEFNLDPDRIGATGTSAGGHLVTLLGLTDNLTELDGELGEFTKLSSRVTCVVNVCGPSDLNAPLMQGDAAQRDDPAVAGLIGGSLKDKADVAKAASPLTYVTSEAVPIMTIHGTQDMRVNFTNAEKLDTALKKAGASSLLIPMTNAGHGIPVGPELAGRIQQFWDLHLRGVKSDISTDPIAVAAAAPKK